MSGRNCMYVKHICINKTNAEDIQQKSISTVKITEIKFNILIRSWQSMSFDRSKYLFDDTRAICLYVVNMSWI